MPKPDLDAVRRELERMPERPFDEFARDEKVFPIREEKRLPDPPLVPGAEF